MTAPALIAALGVCMAVACGQSDSDYSIQYYQAELKANPANSLAHYLLAEVYFQQNNYQSASSEYRAALSGNLQPAWVVSRSHAGLGRVFELTGQHERAVNELWQAAQTDDNIAQAQDIVAAVLQPGKPADPPITTPAAFRTHLRPFGPQAYAYRSDPEYSDEARAAGLEGTVFVTTAVAPDGTPSDPRVEAALGLGLDEKAIDAVAHWQFAPAPQGSQAQVAVDFLLPAKLSRWHLVGARFEPPEGATRPVFRTEPYPLGAGVSDRAIDEGWVISSIPRAATVTLRFDVDEHGVPRKFQVLAASAPLWGNEAIAMVRDWRFTPGAKDGKEVSVPCTLDLVWGQKVWTPALLARMRETMKVPAAPNPATDPAQSVHAQEAPTVISAYVVDDGQPRSDRAVLVSALVGQDGVPASVQLVRGLGPEYDSAAIEAVRKWSFLPALLNGTGATATVTIELDFSRPVPRRLK
jgi:TonB family protein